MMDESERWPARTPQQYMMEDGLRRWFARSIVYQDSLRLVALMNYPPVKAWWLVPTKQGIQ